ncbi:putative rhamnosyl transferase [Thalassococcus sp. S3]|uniref:putative rhamnosyl transferase n=1 Tax=Thalassococcus sp. S3 TaxID=2017482 RepID=UPI0010247B74|nr:putative rhamnosyl transferase [Thalassococcus sp. S3]QBF30098.1 hypothetical protein CFI11_02545 [Thalassococcus sp. S3]
MKVIGLCRFSYPAEGGFQVEHETLQDRIAYLYRPERMEERFRHFETVMLPGLKAQTDPDFTFLIVIGESLPQLWRERLMDLVAAFPQAKVEAHPPGPHRKVMQGVLNEARGANLEPCLQFRHDDDDAVAVDFIERLKSVAKDCDGLLHRNRLVAFDFNRGYVAQPDARGILAAENFTPFWGVALAVAVQQGVRQSIMNFAHNKLPRFMPAVSITDSPMFVRGHNDFNDSRQGSNVRQVPLERLNEEGEDLFRNRFAIDADHVRRVFSDA